MLMDLRNMSENTTIHVSFIHNEHPIVSGMLQKPQYPVIQLSENKSTRSMRFTTITCDGDNCSVRHIENELS